MYFLPLIHALGYLELLSEKEILEGALNSVVFHTAQMNGSGKGIYDPITNSVADAWLICSWKPPTTEGPIFPKQSSLMFTLSLWEGGFSYHQLPGTSKKRLLITTAQRTFFLFCFDLVFLFTLLTHLQATLSCHHIHACGCTSLSGRRTLIKVTQLICLKDAASFLLLVSAKVTLITDSLGDVNQQ